MRREKRPAKDLVKEIFDKTSQTTSRISGLFTHFKRPTKVVPAQEKELPPVLKALPAAIDIGTSAVKLLQLAEESKSKDLQIISLDREAYSEPIRTTEPLTAQREALQRILQRNRIGQEVVTGLSGQEVQVYNLAFPLEMPEAELEKAIYYKLVQLKPFNLDIDSISYDFLKYEERASQQRMLVLAASKETISERLSLLEEFGLKLKALEVSPVSLLNLARFQKPLFSKDELILWLDMGGHETSMVIERQGLAHFIRSLPFTSSVITRQISQHCGVSLEEAEKLKEKYGLAWWSRDKKMPSVLEPVETPKDISERIFYALISSLENFVIDIEHSFKYFSYQTTQSEITKFDRLMLSGGGANLMNLDNFLGARLAVPVQKIDPLSLFRISDAVRSQRRETLSQSHGFSVCAGISLSGKIKEKRPINLLSEKRRKPKEALLEILKEGPPKVLVSFLGLAVLLASLETGRAIYYKVSMDSLNDKVKAAQVELSRLQSEQLKLAKEESESVNRKKLLTSKLAFLKGSQRRPESFSKVLSQIASMLPEEIWVTKLSCADDKLTITGSTSNTQVVMNLVESLKAQEDLADADFSYTQRDPSALGVYNFEVSATLK